MAGEPASRGATAEAPAAPPDAPDVLAALSERRHAIDGCIAEADIDGGTLAGRRFGLLVEVDPAGSVSGASVDDPEIAPTAVAACLSSIARALTFWPFDGDPISVRVPLRYRDYD